jgi:hypothetical protein
VAVFISTVVLIYLMDTFLVGVSFFALKERFHWPISRRMSFLFLVMVFVFIEYYLLPMAVVLDITFTVGNSEVANSLDLKPNESFAGLFDFGAFEIIMMAIQALLASMLGEKLFPGRTSTSD